MGKLNTGAFNKACEFVYFIPYFINGDSVPCKPDSTANLIHYYQLLICISFAQY